MNIQFIKTLRTHASWSTKSVYEYGDIVDVNDSVAKSLIADGFAVEEISTVEEYETKILEPTVKAITKKKPVRKKRATKVAK